MHHAEDPSIYFRFYTQPIFQNKDHCNYTQFSMCKFIFNECLIKCQYFRHQILNQEFCFFFLWWVFLMMHSTGYSCTSNLETGQATLQCQY